MSNNNIPDCFYRVSIKALVLDETRTKFLLIKENNGVWELPGGGLDHGMNPKEELSREIKEEMGLKTTWIADNPSYFLTSSRTIGKVPGAHVIANVVYEAKLNNLDFKPSDECVELRFVSVEEARELNLFDNVKAFLKMFDPEKHVCTKR